MKLVEDWRDAWKWWSMHVAAGSGAFNILCVSTVKGASFVFPLVGSIPGKWVFWGGLLASAGFAAFRLICQKPKTDG